MGDASKLQCEKHGRPSALSILRRYTYVYLYVQKYEISSGDKLNAIVSRI